MKPLSELFKFITVPEPPLVDADTQIIVPELDDPPGDGYDQLEESDLFGQSFLITYQDSKGALSRQAHYHGAGSLRTV